MLPIRTELPIPKLYTGMGNCFWTVLTIAFTCIYADVNADESRCRQLRYLWYGTWPALAISPSVRMIKIRLGREFSS
jgi:hypothetical protein